MSESTEMAYVAREKCGCVKVAVTNWAYEHDRDSRKELARAMVDGLTVERMAVETVRIANWKCPQCKD